MDARRMKNTALVVIDLRNAFLDEDNGCIDYERNAYMSALSIGEASAGQNIRKKVLESQKRGSDGLRTNNGNGQAF